MPFTAFISAPILLFPDRDDQFFTETDASDYAMGAILSQRGEDEHLHPCAFMSKSFSPAEINYEVYDKEMLAIITSFKEWRIYLEGTLEPIIVYTDHENLQFFMTTKILSRCQARWAELL